MVHQEGVCIIIRRMKVQIPAMSHRSVVKRAKLDMVIPYTLLRVNPSDTNQSWVFESSCMPKRVESPAL